jgi:MurNAc alpha-1-phosphate uridylyltransferase
MIPVPRSAMVLGAGLGTRLRPVTDTLPKPLVEVGGRALLDHAIDRLEAVGVTRIVVNVHYLAPMMTAHLARRTHPAITISPEPELLETGGGVRRALPLLDEAFFVVNADVFWLDGRTPALARLAREFDAETMDALLLMQRTVGAVGYDGNGDYRVDPLGRPRRRQHHEVAPFLFSGIQLLHRRLFDGVEERAFSLNRLYDRAEAAGRLRAIVHDGEYYHVGTPEGLAATHARLRAYHIEC